MFTLMPKDIGFCRKPVLSALDLGSAHENADDDLIAK